MDLWVVIYVVCLHLSDGNQKYDNEKLRYTNLIWKIRSSIYLVCFERMKHWVSGWAKKTMWAMCRRLVNVTLLWKKKVDLLPTDRTQQPLRETLYWLNLTTLTSTCERCAMCYIWIPMHVCMYIWTICILTIPSISLSVYRTKYKTGMWLMHIYIHVSLQRYIHVSIQRHIL